MTSCNYDDEFDDMLCDDSIFVSSAERPSDMPSREELMDRLMQKLEKQRKEKTLTQKIYQNEIVRFTFEQNKSSLLNK